MLAAVVPTRLISVFWPKWAGTRQYNAWVLPSLFNRILSDQIRSDPFSDAGHFLHSFVCLFTSCCVVERKAR